MKEEGINWKEPILKRLTENINKVYDLDIALNELLEDMRNLRADIKDYVFEGG